MWGCTLVYSCIHFVSRLPGMEVCMAALKEGSSDEMFDSLLFIASGIFF